MAAVGYALLGEEHSATELVRNAQRAEAAGFTFAAVSDHYHPWLDSQGESPFVWSVLGAIAQATDELVLGTAVTCPTVRIHPAIIAQAAATMGTLAPGRFFLGVGSGEYLNEHVLGDPWPLPPVRLAMLDEALRIIRDLWSGEERSHEGEFYTVQYARIYSMPETPPPILVAASGGRTAAGAAERGNGIIATSPDADLVREWEQLGGRGPKLGMLHLVYARDEETARQTFADHWSHAPLPAFMNADLRRPAEFKAASELIPLETYGETGTPLGPDPQPVLDQIREFESAGFDHVLLHQVGPGQDGFLRFFQQEIAPQLQRTPALLAS